MILQIKESPTNLWIILTKLNTNRWCFDRTIFESFVMSWQPFDNIDNVASINIGIPQFFPKNSCSGPNFLILDLPIAQLSPHAGFTPNNIDPRHNKIVVIQLPPMYKIAIAKPIIAPEAKIKICPIIIGQYDRIFPACQFANSPRGPPPLNNIILINWHIDIFIGPIDNFLSFGNLTP